MPNVFDQFDKFTPTVQDAPGPSASAAPLAAAGSSGPSKGGNVFDQFDRAAAAPDSRWDFTDQVVSSIPFAGDVAGAAKALPAVPRAIYNAATGSPDQGKSPGDLFREGKADMQASRDAYAAAHPWLSPAATVIGAATVGAPTEAIPAQLARAGATGVAAPTAAAAPATLRGAVVQGAKTGATLGALQGAGDTSDPNATVSDRLENAGAGALGGAAFGSLAPLAVNGIRAGWNAGVRPFYAPFTQAGQRDIAGRVLSEAAGGPAPMRMAPVQGMEPTAGQASNNPGLLWLERSVQQATPAGKTLADASRTANNQALRNAIGQVGDVSASGAAPQTMADALESARNTAKAATRTAWKAAGVDQLAGIPTQPLSEAVNGYLDGLKQIEKGYVPPEVKDALKNLGDTTDLGEIQAIRAAVGGEARQAARAGNDAKARVLFGLQDQVDNFLSDPAATGFQIPPGNKQAYDAARAATRDFKQTFQQPGVVRNILGVDRYGADKVPTSATADQVITSGKGAPEKLWAYLAAIDKATPDVKAQAYDAARSAFAQKFLDAAESQIPDQAGDKFILAGKANKFLGDYAHVINSPLFTDAQRNLLQTIGEGADMASRTARAAPPGGSDTFAKLSGDRFIDALLGKWPARLMAAGTGAIGGHFAGGPIGSIGGAIAGGALGDRIGQALYRAPRDKVVGLITQAMHDPQLAQTLMMPRNATPFIPKPALTRLLTVLGTTGYNQASDAMRGHGNLAAAGQ